MNAAFESACREGNERQISELISNHIGDLTILLRSACKSGHIPTVRRLLSNIENEYDRSVCGLQTACRFGHLKLVEFMITDGGLNTKAVLNEGMYAACRFRRKRIVELFLSNGADDLNGALERLADFQDLDIIAMLLKLGATNAADVFDGSFGYDTSYCLQRLLQETDTPRSSLKNVVRIDYTVFAPLDRFVDGVCAELANVGWPAVLQTIVAEYCVNL